ncbi:MAG: phosphomannomutase/phosphoglucomutase [Lachnospiraceae bacterium]|nr:phosphomannomutase/phosphoglucomutase [Lachnospiraceae bacterium]
MIYKDCDIRGVYGEELKLDEVRLIGRALGTMLSGRSIIVCGDVRTSTPDIRKELIQGLMETGGNIIDIGIVPTPVAYYAKSKECLNAYALAIVTASHNPAKYNGIKLMIGSLPPTPEDIRKIAGLVKSEKFRFSEGSTVNLDVRGAYEKKMLALSGRNERTLKVVLDIGNGTTAGIARSVYENCGYEVCELFPEADGNFPNRNPNPADFKNLKAICQKVIDEHADFGVAFDGDGDRAVFIDDKGRPVINEKSLIMLTKLKSAGCEPGFSVVYDQKCSRIVPDTIEELGGEAILERSGHAFIKKRFLENKSLLAGEISGHFFFRELGHDDGMYAGLCIGNYIIGSGRRFSELAETIPTPHISPDLRYKVSYDRMDDVLKSIRDDFSGYPVSDYDGIRVELPNAWFLVRKSVTAQEMTLRIEAESDKKLDEIRENIENWYFAE